MLFAMNAKRAVIFSALVLTTACSSRAAENLYAYRAELLMPRVHLLTQGNTFHIQPRGNVGVIEQRDGIVLVDSGGSPAAAQEVIDFVRSRTRKPVIAIVLTHWHGDHVLGLSRLIHEWPMARVLSTPPTRDMLADRSADRFMPGDDAAANETFHKNVAGGIDYLKQQSQDARRPEAERAGFAQAAREYAQFATEMKSARRVVPTETFSAELLFYDDEVPVEVHFFGRANTAGDAIVWLPRQRVVMTGDVVAAPIPFGFNTYPAEWIGVLRKIQALEYFVLVPGHGSAIRNSAYVERLIVLLEDVRRKVAPFATRTDIDAAGVARSIDLDAARDAFVGTNLWLRLWFRDYWQVPIASSALREARGEEIRQGAD
jgi:glyoxylase-like metal-dependent hydrolase (beta-lactamase superfamily II)